MSDYANFDSENFKPKSFWQRPEGVTGSVFLIAILAGLGYLVATNIEVLLGLAGNVVALAGMLLVLGAIVYMVLDPKMRNLVWYMYKSAMRKVTGIFVNIDPIGVLKSYVEDLEDNLRKMSKQIGNLRGQMRKMTTMMQDNQKEIDNNLKLASVAKQQGKQQQVILSTRKAARMREVNSKYGQLHKKMEVMSRILTKMYQNSEILLEDTRDQVKIKEQERAVIRTSHSAMKSAMNIINGNKDKKQMFDMAVEAIADDVANKVGEMERFMEMSSNFMDSVDLKNGVFEEEGLKMLEKWEKESTLMLMGDGTETLDLNQPTAQPEIRKQSNGSSSDKYDNLFE